MRVTEFADIWHGMHFSRRLTQKRARSVLKKVSQQLAYYSYTEDEVRDVLDMLSGNYLVNDARREFSLHHKGRAAIVTGLDQLYRSGHISHEEHTAVVEPFRDALMPANKFLYLIDTHIQRRIHYPTNEEMLQYYNYVHEGVEGLVATRETLGYFSAQAHNLLARFDPSLPAAAYERVEPLLTEGRKLALQAVFADLDRYTPKTIEGEIVIEMHPGLLAGHTLERLGGFRQLNN